jgi:FkbM family methyltransferase
MATIIKKFQLYGFRNFIIFSLLEINRRLRRIFLQSFSQNKEDLIIEKILQKKIISYIDIGSNHPIKFNNTYRFYLHGARGINIEPNLSLIKKYQKIRPKDKNLHLGLAKQNGSSMFYQLDPDVNSTFSQQHVKEKIKEGCIKTNQYSVKISTLKQIFQKYYKNRNVDLVSIDTEGYDYQILKGNDWSQYRPRIICIEDNSIETQKLLINLNYSLKFITINNSIYLDEKK